MFFKNKKIISISSARRLNKTNTEPHDFSVNVDLPKDNNFTHCVVLEALVPKTYLLFNSNDNRDLVVNETNPVVQITATISPGQYDVNTLATELEDQLTLASAKTYTVTFDEVEQNYVVTVSADTFSIETTNAEAPLMMRVLGFDNPAADDMNSADVAPTTLLLGNDVVDIERTSEIIIRSNIGLNYNDNDIAVLYPDNFLAGSQITYAPAFPENYSLDLPNNKPTVFKFQVFDDQGDLLQLKDAVRFKMLFWERLE